MFSLMNSSKFLTIEQLPHIEAATLFSDVYVKLWDKQVSAFLLVQNGVTSCFVNGADLAEAVIEEANDDSALLREYCSTPVGSLLANLAPRPVSPIIPLLPDPIPVDSSEQQLDQQPEAIFSVVEKGKQVGWYLNNETVRATATRRTVFICSRSHDNSDPDKGRCYKCPAKIVRREIR